MLVTYGTGEGHTAKVADCIASVIGERGHDVTALPVPAASTLARDDFDAVLVGSPINYQRHLPTVVEFVARNREALSTRPAGIFQLSLAPLAPFGLGDAGDRAYVDELTEGTGWRRALPEVDRRGTAALGVAAVGFAGAAYLNARRRGGRRVPATAEPEEAPAGTEVPISE